MGGLSIEEDVCEEYGDGDLEEGDDSDLGGFAMFVCGGEEDLSCGPEDACGGEFEEVVCLGHGLDGLEGEGCGYEECGGGEGGDNGE